MNIQFPGFIGRDRELAIIDRQIARWGTTIVVNIAGSGGIGKTAILRRVREQYQSSPITYVTDIVDFSHTVHRSEAWILDQIIAVSASEFRTHRRKMRKVQSAEEPLIRLQYETELVDAFVTDFNKLASHRRFVLLFDTLELIQDSPLFGFILELTRRLENTVLIMAGRRNDHEDVAQELERIFKKSQIKNIKLGGFLEQEAMLYFEKTYTPHLEKIHPNLQKNIFLLSDGKPIKIALSLDWLDRGIPILPDVMKMDPAALRRKSAQEIKTLRDRFESALMDGIRRFQSPVDEVILFMAHLNRRFNRKMLEFLFLGDLPPKQRSIRSRALLNELKSLPFVKYTSDDYFVLHDEMNRLVQSYVWDISEDQDRTRRKRLSARICEYYEQELNSLPTWENSTEQERVTRRSYEVEALYYRLYADFRSGFWHFERLFETLTADRRSGLAMLILNIIQEFKSESDYSKVIQCFIDGYYSGGVLIARQKFEEASKKLVQGERQLKELLSSYDWSNAGPLDQYLRERIYLVYQQLGYCYRSMGDWRDAEDNYQHSLDLALDVGKKVFQLSGAHDRKKVLVQQIAETLNNLGNLYRLTGEFYDARLLCQTGILLRQAWGLDTVMSLYVMSMILWEMGDTAASMAHLSRAEQECTDEFKLALLKKYHAYILFRTGLSEAALPMLGEAEATFRQKLLRSELADALNIRCRIYRKNPELIPFKGNIRSHMKTIEELGREAYLLAVQGNDKFRIAECHLTQAYHYYGWSRIDASRAEHYLHLSLDQWKRGVGLAKGGYHQIYSLYCQLRGDLAFDAPKPDYELAFDQYTEQCSVGTHFKQATYERGIDHIGDRLRSISSTEPGRALQYVERIISAWCSNPQLAQRTELVDELNDVKQTIEEQEQLKVLQAKYEQAMRKGKLVEANRYSDEILKIPGFYTDANRAEVLLQKSRVSHRQERFAEARRYANIALQLGKNLKADSLTGNAHLMLTSILWDTTSTAEAADHLKAATRIFEETGDQTGLIHARRFQNYILYRTGIFEGLIERLGELAAQLDQNQMTADAADIYNIMSRVSRTNSTKRDLEKARQFADAALARADASEDAYRKAESLLSLAILSQRERNFKEILAYYKQGIQLLPAEAHAIRTVFEGIRGSAYYEMSRQARGKKRQEYQERAFEAFSRELAEASQSKPASLVRTTELLFQSLAQLPSAREVAKYSGLIEETLHQLQDQYPHLAPNMPSIEQMLEQVRQFYPFLQADPDRKDD